MISTTERFLPKLSHIPAVLLMVQAWNPVNFEMAGSWNFVCWTLSCEAFFYFVFPLLHTQIEKLSSRIQLLLLFSLFALTITFNLTGSVIGSTTNPFRTPWFPLAVQRLPEFLMGVTLGNLFNGSRGRARERTQDDNPQRRVWLTYVAAFGGLGMLCHAQWHWSSLIVLPSALLVFGLASEKTFISDFLSTKIMVFGGAISYSMYLLQTSAKDIARWIALHIGIHSDLWSGIEGLVLLVILSAVSFELVEKPFRDLIRTLFAKREGPLK
jgi:peptidoglycan/LPS O-acetylase OafA/YrhL